MFFYPKNGGGKSNSPAGHISIQYLAQIFCLRILTYLPSANVDLKTEVFNHLHRHTSHNPLLKVHFGFKISGGTMMEDAPGSPVLSWFSNLILYSVSSSICITDTKISVCFTEVSLQWDNGDS